MFFVRSAIVAALFASLCVCTRAAADEPVIEVQARSLRKITASNALDATAAATVMSLDDRASMPRLLTDVLRESPGAVLVSTGGIGAFASVSLRGASDDETLVLLDEIPLTTPDGGAFDLSLFPVELFQQVNTFRGGSPVWLGSGAIGGVLQLVPRRTHENGWNLSLGAGSFGTYQMNGGTSVALDNGLISNSQIVVRNTQGHYPYRDDGGTRFDASDDHTLRLKNSDFLEMSGLQDLSVPLWGGTLHAIAMGVNRGGGLPGPAAQPTPQIRREATRALTAVDYVREAGQGTAYRRKLQLLASGSYSADRFIDEYGELGTSDRSDRDNDGYRVFLRGAGSQGLVHWLQANLVSTYAYDRYAPHDRLKFPQPHDSTRHTAAAAGELVASGSVGGVRMELRPSARIEWSETTLYAPPGYTRGAPRERKLVLPTFRVGGVIEPWRGVAFSASGFTGTRLPTIFELFGDGGPNRPNLSLQPVKSTGFDGGVTLRGHYRWLRGSLEQRGYWMVRHDSIISNRGAQYTAQYVNQPDVHQHGTESHARASLGDYVALNGSFTWLDTRNALEKRLPFRPRFTGYVRPELRVPFAHALFSSASVSSELWHRSYTFYNINNLGFSPACTKLAFSAAVGMFKERVHFTARMDDSLDARCQDSLAYPLQGRSLFFSLSYREVDHEES